MMFFGGTHKQALEEIRQSEKWSNTIPEVQQRKKQQADARNYRNSMDRVQKEARTEYANHNMNERLKLRRRLQTVLQVRELGQKQENKVDPQQKVVLLAPQVNPLQALARKGAMYLYARNVLKVHTLLMVLYPYLAA